MSESRQTLTLPSDSIWGLMRIARPRVQSDTRHCPMLMSKSVCRTSDRPSDTIVGQWGKTYSCYGSRQTLTLPPGCVWCLMKTEHARCQSDTRHSPMVMSKSCLTYVQKTYQALSASRVVKTLKTTTKNAVTKAAITDLWGEICQSLVCRSDRQSDTIV